ncbi:hypothetical protein ACQEU6_24585 [Spirillospora sp. CA-108201]
MNAVIGWTPKVRFHVGATCSFSECASTSVIHLIPVVLGAGRRLFGADRIEVELTRVLDAPGVTHLRYRVASGTAAG